MRISFHDQETFHKTAFAVETIGNKLNSGDRDVVVAGIVQGLKDQHRHLQAETIVAHKLCKLLRERFVEELFWK